MNQISKISNQDLDALGDRFVIRNIRAALGITFEQYLVDPARFDDQADRLRLKMDAAGNVEIIGDARRRAWRVFRQLPAGSYRMNITRRITI
jgi:hypothetical protein